MPSCYTVSSEIIRSCEIRGKRFTVRMSISWSWLSCYPFMFASVFIILTKTFGSCLNSSIFKYSYSTAKISRQGKIKRHVSRKVRTFSMDSKSKINSSRSFNVEYADGLPSLSVSDSHNKAYNSDYLGVRLSSEEESSSLSVPFSYNFPSFGVSLSRCRFMNSSMASSSSTSSMRSPTVIPSLESLALESLLLELNFSIEAVFYNCFGLAARSFYSLD